MTDEATRRDEAGPVRAAFDWIREPSHRFIPLFLVYLWLLSKLSDMIPPPQMQAFLRATAWIDAALLAPFFESVTQNGTTVTLNGFAVQIITECTGLFEAVILVSAVLAYKASWSERLIGIGLGVSILYAINLVRIAVLLLVGRYLPQFFDFAHVYFWQSILIVFITALWLVWIHYFVDDETSPPLRA
jgi:exosortase H (IPTLxxWG-CTERM-specific)